MKKKVFTFAVVLILILAVSSSAFAEDENGWYVIFTNNRTMLSNFNERTINDMISGMLPGDTETFTVKIANQNTRTTRWYMENKVLQSLEKSGFNLTNGGGYSYKLEYTGLTADGSIRSHEVIYDSDVGGEVKTGGREGLTEATLNLEDYFFLDTLNYGEGGIVTLTVSLDGETQGNVYQNTFGDIQMRFAVELDGRTAVRTADENNLTPYYIVMVVAGLLFLYLALDAITDRMYKKGKG